MSFLIESNYREVQARLKAVSPLAAKNLRKAVTKELGPIVSAARANAAGIGTGSLIPPSVQPYVTARKQGIRIARKRSPAAGLYELGSGSKGSPKPWRHPVFGNREVWVSQNAHPFVAPAIAAHRPAVEAGIRVALERAAREAGFRSG